MVFQGLGFRVCEGFWTLGLRTRLFGGWRMKRVEYLGFGISGRAVSGCGEFRVYFRAFGLRNCVETCKALLLKLSRRRFKRIRPLQSPMLSKAAGEISSTCAKRNCRPRKTGKALHGFSGIALFARPHPPSHPSRLWVRNICNLNI